MKQWQKNKIDSIKGVVDNDLWRCCKWIRNDDYLLKAAKLVAIKMQMEDIESIRDPKEKDEAYEDWAYENRECVRYLLNKRRNYVSTELGDAYVSAFNGGNGKKIKGDGSEKGEDGSDDEKELDLSNPKTLKCPDWLPNPTNILQLVLRDPAAWGYNDKGELEDEAKQKKMDVMLAWYWDVMVSKCCGQTYWPVSKRCYTTMSDGAPNPTRADPNPEPYVHHSNEAVLVWMVENHYTRWETRAKYSIQWPERKIYKDENKNYKKGLEGLEGKYTSPAGGRQPFGGLTAAGRKRLLELVPMIEKNRQDNARFIKSVEERVQRLVHKKNGRVELDKKKGVRGKKKATNMASAVPVQEEEACDMNDMGSW